jgi:hypothetical protein
MFSVNCHVGRLIETRLHALASLEEVAQLGERFRDVAARLPHAQLVICGDYRGLRVFAPEVAERFTTMLSRENARVERSAILCSPEHATSMLQIERTVKNAGSPSRRAFRVQPDLEAWLGEVLTDEEKARLSQFLAS